MKKIVIFVDDGVENRENFEDAALSVGLLPVLADSVRTGKEAISANPEAVRVVTDWHLKDGLGSEIVRHAQASGFDPEQIVVASDTKTPSKPVPEGVEIVEKGIALRRLKELG